MITRRCVLLFVGDARAAAFDRGYELWERQRTFYVCAIRVSLVRWRAQRLWGETREPDTRDVCMCSRAARRREPSERCRSRRMNGILADRI